MNGRHSFSVPRVPLRFTLGFSHFTPSAYLLKMPQLQSFFYAKQMPAASQAAAGEFGCQSLD